MKTILLLGAGGTAGNNFVKSIKLKDKSIKIIGVDVNFYNLISCNSDIKELITFKTNKEKINLINNIIKKYNVNFIHAQPDKEVEFLCRFKHKIKCDCFNHSLEEHEIFSNKLKCAKIWKEKLNLNFKSYSLEEVLNNKNLWNNFYTNNKVWCRAIQGAGSRAALPVSSLQEAKSWATYWANNKGLEISDFMLSDFLPGKEYAIQTFWLDGELYHAQARERIEYLFGNQMPSGQSSTPSLAKIISDEVIYKFAKKTIFSIVKNPHGIYCIDLKENALNELIPMEVNYGRFFTTTDFFAELGVNTPYEYINYKNKNITKKINSIKKEFYWIRGIDKNPVLYEK